MTERRKTSWWRFGGLVLLVLGAAVVAWRFGLFDFDKPQQLQRVTNEAHQQTWFGPIFIAAYVVLAALALPISPFSIVGGAIFGFAKGALYVWLASVLGGAAGYWLARLVGGKFIERLLRTHPETLDRLHDKKHAFWPVLRLQLLPVAPFGLVNAASATSGVPFVSFIVASALGVIPGTIAYVFVGDRLRAGLGRSQGHAVLWAGVIGVALVALSFLPRVVRRRKS
jgi:uncharacterized membrane protein YdjX (TVP38/TMEM64 family)